MPCNVLCFLSHLEHLSGARGAPRQALPPSVSVEGRSLAREMPLLVDSLSFDREQQKHNGVCKHPSLSFPDVSVSL